MTRNTQNLNYVDRKTINHRTQRRVNANASSNTWKRILLWSCAAACVSVSILLGLVLYQFEVPSVYADPSTVLQLQERIRNAEIAAAAGHPQVIQVNQAELNSFVKSHLVSTRKSAHQNRLRDLSVRLAQDKIGVHVFLDIYGTPMTIDIVGTLRTVNGYAQFEPVSAQIGALPIPRSALIRALKEAMDSTTGRENMRLPHGIKDLRVENSNLIATYE